MSERSSSKGILFMIAPDTNESEGTKISAITQEEIDEQIRNFIAPLMGQLEDLTWPFQGMTAATHFKIYPMTGNYARCRAARKQPDTCASLSQVASLGVLSPK